MAGILSNLLNDQFSGSALSKPMTHVRLIVGLGNPGLQYDQTRHNVGFMALDALAERLGVTIRRKAFNALAEDVMLGDLKLVLLKPQQYMNRSGHALATAAGFYKLSSQEVMVVLDDLALPVGQLRIRAKGSAGGHNGLKDIIARLGTDAFARLRIGIGDSGTRDAADYVLSRFGADERAAIEQAVSRSVDALLFWAQNGTEPAMNRYNSRGETDASGGKNEQRKNSGDMPQNEKKQNP
jgi:PTH1 family peptidyl-tRNA hydrolase